MTSRAIKTRWDLDALMKLLAAREYPYTVTVTKGVKRTNEQNRLQRLWLTEIAEQRGETVEDVRALCKLQIGVPILRTESDSFREDYDRVFKPLLYPTKIALMKEPFDFPVTRLMTTAQKTKYLDEMFRFWSGQGVVLTQPPDGWEKAA